MLNRVRTFESSEAAPDAMKIRLLQEFASGGERSVWINGLRLSFESAVAATGPEWMNEAIRSAASQGWTLEKAVESDAAWTSGVVVFRKGAALRCLALINGPASEAKARTVLKVECDDIESQERWVNEIAAGSGGDAPGDDPPGVPRPDGARRVFSMALPPHHLVGYKGWDSEEQARAVVESAFANGQWERLTPGWIMGATGYESLRDAVRCWVRVGRDPNSNEVVVAYMTQPGEKS